MAASAGRMRRALHHGVHRHHVDKALRLQDAAIRARSAPSLSRKPERGEMLPGDRERAIERSGLSGEQRIAIQHITGPEQIAAVIGFAGAGKSTMLAAARDAWERQGYRVHGAALAGKAAEGLEQSSGIASRTLASWEYGWQSGRGQLGKGDVLVIDEAGMVGSRQLAEFVKEAEARGAKLVLVGDHEQLQAIGAGSPFRAIAERVGAVELSEIRRQKEGWQREASIAFATHRTGEGLESYAHRGAVHFSDDRDRARADLVRDYLTDLDERWSGSRIALAHRRIDVRAINADIRAALQDCGRLARGGEEQGALGREVIYQTNDGKRSFAPGDRIVLLENDRDLRVKNGMLGTVSAVASDGLKVRLDGHSERGLGSQEIRLPTGYRAFDHGYATTIHKSQGATVDRAFVMASGTMDRHLTYVAMTRHRDSVQLYADRDELKDMKTLAASMSRSGAKETTLDYTRAFAERRGLAEGFGLPSEIAVSLSPGRAEDRPPAHSGAMNERVRSPAAPQPSAHVEAQGGRQGVERADEKVEPLVPAVTSYSRSVEEIAREKARPGFERGMAVVRSIGRNVYVDSDGVAVKLSVTIVDKGISAPALTKSIAEQPEQFGGLRGTAGFLGESKERKVARYYAKALGHHVASASQTWERRLEAERENEIWKRERCDVIEVPGLTKRSEIILMQLDDLSQAEKPKFIEQLLGTPEGKQALDEAKAIAKALRQRFGRSDPRDLKQEDLRLGPEVTIRLDRVKGVARITERAERAELSRQYELAKSLRNGLGLGM